VTPIEQTKGRIPRSAQVPPSGELVPRGRGAEAKAAIEDEDAGVHAHLRALVEGKQRFEVEDDGRRISGRRVDLPKEALRKLRRGTTPIDARIDLHGMGVAEARPAVETFLRTARVAGERCVLIIHGKGEHSPRAQPVLRGEIGAWLSQGAASEKARSMSSSGDERDASLDPCWPTGASETRFRSPSRARALRRRALAPICPRVPPVRSSHGR
jgi:DNA-nicking Smr family endonuclease